MSIDLTRTLHEHNELVGVHDVHLPGSWLLNARRVLIPLVPNRQAKKRLFYICSLI
jgi:hypothetical protein